jgi:hypothetical protein
MLQGIREIVGITLVILSLLFLSSCARYGADCEIETVYTIIPNGVVAVPTCFKDHDHTKETQ